MELLNIFTFMILYLASFACGHKGMVNNEVTGDVGVVFSGPNFSGRSHIVYASKGKPKCEPLNMDVISAQICKANSTCTFFTASHCETGGNNFAIAIPGGDNSSFITSHGNWFGSYICTCDGTRIPVNETIHTIPHDTNLDVLADAL